MNKWALIFVVLLGAVIMEKSPIVGICIIGAYLLYGFYRNTGRRALRKFRLYKKMEKDLQSLKYLPIEIQKLRITIEEQNEILRKKEQESKDEELIGYSSFNEENYFSKMKNEELIENYD